MCNFSEHVHICSELTFDPLVGVLFLSASMNVHQTDLARIFCQKKKNYLDSCHWKFCLRVAVNTSEYHGTAWYTMTLQVYFCEMRQQNCSLACVITQECHSFLGQKCKILRSDSYSSNPFGSRENCPDFEFLLISSPKKPQTQNPKQKNQTS